jgi:hypothetical protein
MNGFKQKLRVVPNNDSHTAVQFAVDSLVSTIRSVNPSIDLKIALNGKITNSSPFLLGQYGDVISIIGFGQHDASVAMTLLNVSAQYQNNGADLIEIHFNYILGKPALSIAPCGFQNPYGHSKVRLKTDANI